MTPHNYTQATNQGYKVTKVLAGISKYRIDMQPRFYKQGMKAVISFLITKKGCKQLITTISK